MTLHRPRPIETTDSTAGFESGESSLDRYLTDRALTNHLSDLARCYVCMASNRVVGYYTLSAVAVEHASLPGRARRNAPNPVPAVLMGRLAVDRKAQGSGLGLGRSLVRDAGLSTLAAADRIGVRLLLVHALHHQAAGFYATLGFKPSPTDPLHLYLLLSDARASLGD